ncbi:MAG TPA: HAD-IA family hydrolase [Candidatus Baltobacteraceae bacterium]|nr:HAD-IA family hydrolase [Candidatus Baltobacteraceae bacterium]
MNRTIDAVLFDLDDTLHDDTLAYQSAAEEVAHGIAAEHGVDALELKTAYIAQAEGFWKRLSPEAFTLKLANVRPQLWRAALETVGVDDEALAHRSARLYSEYRKKYYAVFPGVVEMLAQLRAAGKKLGIVTNGFAETHHEKIALLRIGEYFDAVFIADEVGMIKPNPLLFAHACATLGSAPARSAMVGDRYDRDIKGAAEAGLFTVYLKVRNDALPHGCNPPDATCGSILEVSAVLLGNPPPSRSVS